jgi:GAF domain-containing protein
MTDLTINFTDGVTTELATIELRRIVDVLQVDHASLFLADSDGQDAPGMLTGVGLSVEEALPEHLSVVERVLSTGRVQEVHHVTGDPRGARSALATPLLADDRAIGALVVVTLREIRRLGLFEAQVLGRATETVVGRILPSSDRFRRGTGSDRFRRDRPAAD